MWFKVFLTTTLLFLPCLQSSAQSLWRESEYGMTPIQVQSKFSGAKAPDTPGTLHGGAIELLRLSGVEIVGRQFKAPFYFKGERLTQVTVSLADKETSHGAKLVFDSLAEVLRAKYGSELSQEVGHGIMESRKSTWLSGETNITLYYNSIGDSDPILNLIYQVRISSEADKV
jgi:hypothetical protein